MKNQNNKAGKYNIKVLDKALKVLELFDERGKGLTVTEINDHLNFNKVSTFRIVKNLEEAGYLEKDQDTSKYRLGLKVYYLGALAEPHSGIRRITRPFLENLNDKCDETVHLAVLNKGEALYLDKIEGKRTIRVITRIGMKLPAHCSGVGKALLAALPEDALEQIIREKGLPRFTNNTITELKALKAELARVGKQGYAIDNEEIEEGLKCAAAPIRDAEGNVVAAISVSVPKERFDKEIRTYISEVKKASQKVSQFIRREGVMKYSHFRKAR